MAGVNARVAAESELQRGEANTRLLEQTRSTLGLSRTPRRVDCFDISNLHGHEPVGSMAVLLDGEPAKQRYRRYRIRTVSGSDDYAMLRELLTRRLSRGQDEGSLPDLLAIDGGRGQVSIAQSVLEELGLAELDVIGIAKGPGRRPGVETLWRPHRDAAIKLRPDDPVLHMLLRVRDEAHRFAVTYHRRLRTKRDLNSRLLEIPGLGPRRVRLLLQHFGSLAALRRASRSQLEQISGVSSKLAARIERGLAELSPGREPGSRSRASDRKNREA
jgi:excinuclease ABC subunit C